MSWGWDYCHSCDRSFVDRKALEQHWTDSYSHWWCRRCDELYDTQEDLESHKRSSMAHWICQKCDIDYAYEGDLQEHYDENSNHNYCTTCARDFISPNNLSQHGITHLPRNKACFSCGDSRHFATWSAMFIHLQNGCRTTINELNRLARMCYQWKHYVQPEYEHYLMYDNSLPRPEAFRCPSCKRTFTLLSSLVQHVENKSCDEGIYHGSGAVGKMIHFVSLRV